MGNVTRGAVALALISVAMIVAGCSQPDSKSFEGIADGEYIRVAASLSGSLANLNVKRGKRVRQGDELFALDAQAESVANREAQARVRQAQEKLATVRRAAHRDAIREAEGALNLARAELAEAQFRLEQKTAKAPTEGFVVDTLYAEGQWVPGGSPVVSIVSPEAMKVRFYVPAHIVGTLRHGQYVSLKCSECSAGMRAQIAYVSPIAVAVGGEVQNTLAEHPRFLVEAKPRSEDAVALRPGSQVQVLL